MRRIGISVVVILLAAAGCSSKEPAAAPPATTAASTSPSSSASATPSASPTSSLIEFTVDGAGPYQLGATLTALQATKSVDEVTPGAEGCPENTSARGTGVWKDVRLSFHKDGKLYLAINRSTSIPTPSGAWLGTTLAQLKTIYVGVTGQELTLGTRSAYLVTTLSGRGILFELDAGKKVSSMSAGDAAGMNSSFATGTAFC